MVRVLGPRFGLIAAAAVVIFDGVVDLLTIDGSLSVRLANVEHVRAGAAIDAVDGGVALAVERVYLIVAFAGTNGVSATATAYEVIPTTGIYPVRTIAS